MKIVDAMNRNLLSHMTFTKLQMCSYGSRTVEVATLLLFNL